MNRKKRFIRRDRSYWAEQITAWRESGLSQTAYCRQNGLNPRSMSNWDRKLSAEADGSASFIEIRTQRLSTGEDEGCIELFLEGMRIKLRESIDPGRLRSIILAVSGCER